MFEDMEADWPDKTAKERYRQRLFLSLVESEPYLALKEVAQELIAQHQSTIPLTAPQILSYLVFSIVRDVINQLFLIVEAEANAARSEHEEEEIEDEW